MARDQRSAVARPQADADYREWEHATAGARTLAVAADAELRRREPEPRAAQVGRAVAGNRCRARRTALPARARPAGAARHCSALGAHSHIQPVRRRAGRHEEDPGRLPRLVWELAEARPAFREELADRQSRRVPKPDLEYGDLGRAWSALAPRGRDAIRQPPAPQMPAAPGTQGECLMPDSP